MVTGLTIIAGLFYLYHIISCVCCGCLNLFPCDGFPQIYTHIILLKDHLDLTTMVQKVCS